MGRYIIMKLILQLVPVSLFSLANGLPPSLEKSNPACPDLSGWTTGKQQKDYSNQPSGVKVYKYLTGTSSKVSYPDADAQCEFEFGGYVTSANIIDKEQNEYVFGNDSPLDSSKEYWFNSFLSTFGVDGKNGGGCDGVKLCSQSWRRCKQNDGGQQCTPYGSDVQFNHYFSHPQWDDNWNNCVGLNTDEPRGSTCQCWSHKISNPPTTVSVFAYEGYIPAFAYKSGSNAKWGCDTKSATTKRSAMCEVLCGDDGLQYKNNDLNWA